jgi:tetratricopeptide (TPR) repeat protein
MVVHAWSDDPARDLSAAEQAARAAIALDPRDAWAHFALSGTLLYLGRHEEALDEAERTLALNPNFAFAHFRLGQVLIYAGRASEAVAPIQNSIRLNPLDPQAAAMVATLALAQYHAGDYAAAEASARSAERLSYTRANLVLAASLARSGRIEEARAVLSPEVQAGLLAYTGRRLIPYARGADRQDLLEALRLAGFREPLEEDADPRERA